MRLSKLMFVAASAICGVVLLPLPASAAVEANVSEACDEAGNVNVKLTITGVEYELVQWYIDGNPAGKTAFGEPLTGYTAGDGQAHKVEAVYLIPSGLDPDVVTVVLPECVDETTTTTTSTTAVSSSTTETVLVSSTTDASTSTVPATTATTAVSTSAPTTAVSTTAASTTETTRRVRNPATVYVTGIPADDPDGGLVVRSGPSATSARLQVLANGTEMTAMDWPPVGRWVQISAPVPGWVGARFVTLAAPGSLDSATSSTTEAIGSPDQADDANDASTPVALDDAPTELPFGEDPGDFESATGVGDPSEPGSAPWIVPAGIALLVLAAAAVGIKLRGNKKSLATASATAAVAGDAAVEVAPEPVQAPFVAQENFGTVVLPKRVPKTSRVEPPSD